MKSKSTALICCVLLICAMASAQEYSIRVKYNTNLRATFSLEGRIVTTVQSGSVLPVIDSFDRWLKISRKSQEVWMANWVGFTRVADQPISSDIDNCCFVDRQCQSDHEWTAGYWAYQNNQCGAPTAAVSVTSPPMTSTDPEQADNCCYLGWLCHSDQDWQTGYIAYQTNQCNHRGIEIEGPDSFVIQLQDTLDFIRERSSHWYGYVINGLNKVRLDSHARRSSVNLWSGTWHVPPARVATWDDKVSIVGSLAHEACHVHRYRSGQKSGELIGERACLEAQRAAVQAVYPSGRQYYLDWATNLLANIENPEYQWWHD